MESLGLDCCGVREFAGLSETPKESLTELYHHCVDSGDDQLRFAYGIFSDTKRSKRGERLAQFITRNKLGTVTATDYHRNPNSGNQLKVWVWALNQPALKAWWKKNREEEDL